MAAQFQENPSIKFIESSIETIESEGIPFEVRLIETLGQKPTQIKTSTTDDKPVAKKKNVSFDPFMEPFEPGLCINELSDSHRLLFNKFCICKEHSLIVTKSMER